MQKKLFFSFILALLLLMATGCSRESEIALPQEITAGMGKITGTVYSKNGVKKIRGALIFTYDKKGKLFATHSDKEGLFSLDVPEGQQNIFIQTGGGTNFRSQLSVTVKKDETLNLSSSQTKLTQVANMAYVQGSFDQIEDIISTLGYTATQISYNDLSNMSIISQYDILFLNCASKPANVTNESTVSANLGAFVSNGGSLYASDWAVTYLIGGDMVSTGCNAPGGFIPDTKLCSINNGAAISLSANIINPGLAAAMGFNSININYDLGSWQKITSYDPSYWDVLVSSTVGTETEALMLKTDKFFYPNVPTVPVGNNSSDGWVTICSLQNGVYYTISVLQADAAVFFSQGATPGSCGAASATNGKIYYTTFHNHATQNIGNSELILEYVITNL